MTNADYTRRSAPQRPVGPLVAVVVSVILLGAVAGALWAMITPAMTGRVVGDDSAIIPAEQFPDEFAGVATFAVVLFGYGVIAVVVAWLTSRQWRGPLGALVVAASTFVGAAIAALVGTWVADVRFDDPRSLPAGAAFDVVPDLWLDGAVRGGAGGPWAIFVCAPLAAALVYLGLALASRHADLGVGDLYEVSAGPSEPTGQPA
ncbi:DUF2567 domain-containing protein [Gordonia sp. CPCC 206044]|uniref:DUF2567 domain-containing protein n=1 Tax=Gordonia sp. CPCC 206044 TaxID=3140793 RepID=UPI003AF3E212